MKAHWLWIEYLKTTDPTTWTAEVCADFISCLNSETASWITANRALFNGPKGAPLPRLYTGQPLSDHQVALVIDVTAADDPITQRVLSYVYGIRDELSLKKSNKWESRRAKYTFTSRCDTDALEIALYAWQHRQIKPLWKVGELLVNRFPIAVRVKLHTDGLERRKVLSDITTRYIKRAETTRAAVIRGSFPV